MTTKDEALKLALEALNRNDYLGWQTNIHVREAIREALAQPEQEPVAWRWKERINNDFDSWVISASEPPPYAIEQQPLYTAPPQRKPEQKPVAHTLNCVCGAVWDIKSDGSEEMAHTPDTTPPQRKPLTEPELHAINPTWPAPGQEWGYEEVLAFARAIEAAHGIKE